MSALSEPAVPNATAAPNSATRPDHLVLVGMMGSGKTSIGRKVGRRIGRRHVDLDVAVSRRANQSIPELFESVGEAGFRQLESEELARVLDDPEPVVLSTGGGAVLSEANRAVMRSGATVIWLRANAATLAARVGSGKGRPLLAEDPVGTITRLIDERAPAYESAAHHIVDVDRRSFEAVTTSVAGYTRPSVESGRSAAHTPAASAACSPDANPAPGANAATNAAGAPDQSIEEKP